MPDVIGITKRLSYLQRISPKKAAAYAVIPVLYGFLPFHAAFHFSSRPFLTLFLFYSVNIAVLFFVIRDSLHASMRLRWECEDIESRLNMQTARNTEILRQNVSLKENIYRYSSLKKVVETITQQLEPDAVCDSLCESAFTSIAAGRGSCALYLLDKQAQGLRLHRTRKEERALVIKAKQGDIFDHWVMMHLNPLLVEDTRNDFRFDLDRMRSFDDRPVGSLISSPLLSGRNFLGVLRLDHSDAGYYNLDDLRFLRAISDLGALALENAQLYSSTQELAIHDGLTSVYTKGYCLELLKAEVRRTLRAQGQFGLLMIDIDHFKAYNDTYGHSAGDIVLKTIAARVSALLRERGGIVCRFGGEEFCVIVPGADRQQAVEAAQLVRGIISRETFVLRRKVTSVTVSVGVAVFPGCADEEIGLLMKADKAMYEAKQAGRNRVVAA
jgi:diguanylate cyclase (GGDEF)-like protein